MLDGAGSRLLDDDEPVQLLLWLLHLEGPLLSFPIVKTVVGTVVVAVGDPLTVCREGAG